MPSGESNLDYPVVYLVTQSPHRLRYPVPCIPHTSPDDNDTNTTDVRHLHKGLRCYNFQRAFGNSHCFLFLIALYKRHHLRYVYCSQTSRHCARFTQLVDPSSLFTLQYGQPTRNRHVSYFCRSNYLSSRYHGKHSVSTHRELFVFTSHNKTSFCAPVLIRINFGLLQ